MADMKQNAVLAALWLAAGAALGGTTNDVPWVESFEAYAPGFEVAGTQGWQAARPGDGTVSTNPAVVAALADYATGGGFYPLPGAAHARVLEARGTVANDTLSASGGVVAVDLMVQVIPVDAPPYVDPLTQYAVVVATNGHVLVWHRDLGPGGGGPATNAWLELANPPLTAGNWARFTVLQDYAHNLFQVSVDNGAPLGHAEGWTAGGVSQPGTWFPMACARGRMASLRFGEDGTNYLDDVVVTNRSLAWTGGGFTERGVNDGTIDAGTPVVVTLLQDTFTGTNGADLAADGRVTVTGLPAGLAAAAHRASATQVTVRLTGTALVHESTDSRADLAIQFADGAFTLGKAWDVAGNPQAGTTLAFLDTPRLAFSANGFAESAENGGAVDNAAPVLIDLAHGTFNGTAGDNFATNGTKAQFGNLPAGLGAELVVQGATQLRLRLTGSAVAHAAADSVTNVIVTLLDGAFNTVPASSVFNASTNLGVTFVDPSLLSYATSVFTETVSNNGTLAGTAITLSNKTFNAAEGEDLVAGGKAVVTHLPAGLGVRIVRAAAATGATLSFTGAAAAHVAADSIANLAVSFGDSAFVGGAAAGVTGAARGDLAIQFSNPPVLTPAGTPFTEAGANDGSIGNANTVTLAGDVFVTGAFAEGVEYTVANVPAGLTVGVAGNGAQATVTLSGSAATHLAADSLANLGLTFLDAAFVNVAAAAIAGHPLTFVVNFADPPSLAYGTNAFTELAGGVIDNRAPLVITVTGDTFSGDTGDEFAGTKVVLSNLPAGLAASVRRDSDTAVSVRLTGMAAAHAASNSVGNVGLTFLDGAFAHALTTQVTGHAVAGLAVQFWDDTGYFNVMPYEEPFEGYANGLLIAGTNGWSADFPDAGIVTNDPAATAGLTAYLATHAGLPAGGDHRQVLSVDGDLRAEVHTEDAPLAYLDFMVIPEPVTYTPDNETNHQYAFYVSTNRQLVIWHRNTTGGVPANEWLTLAGAGTISTSEWVRFTVAQDYATRRFQVRVNEGAPVVDADGWTESGLSTTGSWFHMVQTNATMTRFKVFCSGASYIDDVTVRTQLPGMFGARAGSVFKFR